MTILEPPTTPTRPDDNPWLRAAAAIGAVVAPSPATPASR